MTYHALCKYHNTVFYFVRRIQYNNVSHQPHILILLTRFKCFLILKKIQKNYNIFALFFYKPLGKTFELCIYLFVGPN